MQTLPTPFATGRWLVPGGFDDTITVSDPGDRDHACAGRLSCC